MVTFQLECHAGHQCTWRSQPVVKKAPLGNILLSAAILFSGLCYTAARDLIHCLGLQVFFAHRKETLVPFMQETWELEDAALELNLKEMVL